MAVPDPPSKCPRRRAARARGGVALLAAVVLAGAACDGGGAGPGQDEDPRYRLDFEARTSPESSRGVLQLFVRPRQDWHFAPEAPAQLALRDAEDLSFAPAVRDETAGAPESLLAFRSEFACTGEGPAVARGELRFGMCQGDSEQCVIVERELALPLEIACGP